MARQAISPTERSLNQLWAVALHCRLGMDVRDMDAQLSIEPKDGQPFVPRVSPAPYLRRLAPRMFQQAYRDGRNPNHRQWRDPGTEAPFNLSERVDSHVPGASDWLMEGLRAYLPGGAIPSQTYSRAMRTACLSRLDLISWPAEVGFLAIRMRPREAIALERMWCRLLADTGHPLALLLLISSLDERQCHYPDTPAVDRLRAATLHCVARLLARDELNFCDKATAIRDVIATPLKHAVEHAADIGGRRDDEAHEDGPPSPVLVFGPTEKVPAECGRSSARVTWRARNTGAPEWQVYEGAQRVYLEDGDAYLKWAIDIAERAFLEAIPRIRNLCHVKTQNEGTKARADRARAAC